MHFRRALSVLAVFLWLSCHVCASQLLKKNLWLECSCMHATERNGSNWGAIALNSSQARMAKNDCYLIFVTAAPNEIVAFRFKELRLREA